MAKTDFKTIDEYQNVFPDEVKGRMQQIREIIHEVFPEVEEVISYQIPAFKTGKYFIIYYSAYARTFHCPAPGAILC